MSRMIAIEHYKNFKSCRSLNKKKLIDTVVLFFPRKMRNKGEKPLTLCLWGVVRERERERKIFLFWQHLGSFFLSNGGIALITVPACQVGADSLEPKREGGPSSPHPAAAFQSGPVVDTDPCAVSPTATASSCGGDSSSACPRDVTVVSGEML